MSKAYIDKTDTELSIEIIRDWSRRHRGSPIEWRQVHAASNILAIGQFQVAEPLASLQDKVAEAKLKVKQAEEIAELKAFADLIAGRALFKGERLPEMSPSAAKDFARKFVHSDPLVERAYADLIEAENAYMKLERQSDALRELSQGGKSTAQRLMQEPGANG